MMKVLLTILACFAVLAMYAVAQKSGIGYSSAVIEILDKAPEQPSEKVLKTDGEWKESLSSVEYKVLRDSGTEPPNGKLYKEFKKHEAGTYFCAGCGAELFTSKEKFDSGSGWPSFYAPSKPKNIQLDVDFKIGYKRTEVLCSKCGGHLGHVFEGENYNTPTDKRYCVNGVCLSFLPEDKKE